MATTTDKTVQDIVELLESYAPLALAEEWDNVGLLVGDRGRTVQRVMVCLTITPSSASEAIENGAGLIITHHPLPFRPLNRLTADTTSGRMLLQLIAAEVAIYSPHTALDSAHAGINQHLATGLRLVDIEPLIGSAKVEDSELGAGRVGLARPSITLRDLVQRTKAFLGITQVQVVGDDDQEIMRIATACGSGADFLHAAQTRSCGALVTGEANFHTCLEAEATGVALVLTGHYHSERFALDTLAEYLGQQLPRLKVWASEWERDPIRCV